MATYNPTQYEAATEGTATFQIAVGDELAKGLEVQNLDTASNLWITADAAGARPIVKIAPGALWNTIPLGNGESFICPFFAHWDGTPTASALVSVIQ